MPVRHWQASFNAGTFTEELDARVDWDKYAMGARCLKNVRCLVPGGAARRAGSIFVAMTKDPAKLAVLVRFEFNVTQAYVMEFGEGYIRFFANRARVLDENDDIYEVQTPYQEEDLRALRFERSADVLYIAHPDYAPRKLSRVSATEFRLQTINFFPPPTAELDEFFAADITLSATTGTFVTVTASAGIFLGGDRGRHLRSAGGGRGAIVNVASSTVLQMDIIDEFESQTIAEDDWWLTGSPNGSAINITDNARPAGTPCNFQTSTHSFRSTDVGKYIHLHGGMVRITSISSTTAGAGIVVKALADDIDTDATAVGDWTLESPIWSDALGHPGVVALHDGRLLWAGSPQRPDGLWGSVSADYENHGVGPLEDDAFFFNLATSGPNLIRWMKGGESLVSGTIQAEHNLVGANDEPLSPAVPPRIKTPTRKGADYNVDAIPVNNATLFLQRGAQRICELAFNFDAGAYVVADLLQRARHLAGTGIVDMAYASSPDSILFAVTADGVLLSLTYERPEQVVAWTHHETDGTYEAVCVIPNACGTGDEVWTIARRSRVTGGVFGDGVFGPGVFGPGVLSEGGETQGRYIEVFDGDYNTDSALKYEGEAVGTFGGLDHLEGKTVKAIDGDWNTYDLVVTGGAITLPAGATATALEAGLNFVSTIETLRPEIPTQKGTATVLRKHASSVTVRVYCQRGTLLLNGKPLKYPAGTDEPYTGDMMPQVVDGWSREGRLTLQKADGLPGTVLAVERAIQVEDG